ncbi:hypothetical protein [Roseburia intestinalis]|jgi:hypothetical protein|uniref:hypothetical protein n=1 Tax=Roseburia intestinalis TaxID=166486 RepID=UPI001570EC12|nr:hypothetical protein [Roseburia intestinalis]NSC35243.1 hypothetical protein [Roseburia intestinalis]
MKKSIEKIGTIATIVIMSVCSYIAGTTQGKTETVTKTITKEVEVIPDNYISLDKCIPLDDVCGWYYDKYDYICFELGDIGKQLDNPNGKSYNDIIADLPHLTDLE